MPTGSCCWSIASSPIAATSGLPPACAMPDCAGKPPSRTSITGAVAASGTFELAARRHATVIAHETVTGAGQAVGAPSRLAGAIEDRCERLVRQLPGELLDEIDDVCIGLQAMWQARFLRTRMEV